MTDKLRFADFHQDRINPQLADILQNPELNHARDRARQIPKAGLAKVDLIFASVYRRANDEIKAAAKGGDAGVLADLQAQNEILIDYYNATSDYRIIRNPGDLLLEDSYEANNTVLHLEGADFVVRPDIVDELYDRGVRSVGVVYNHDNSLGGGAGGYADVNRGLTELGKSIVDRLVERRMIVDISHANRRTAADILERVRGYDKTVATHTALDLGSHKMTERTITPDFLRQISERGGVVGFTPATPFFPTFEQFIDAIKHASDVVGSHKHIAVGTDFGGLDNKILFEEFDEIGKFAVIAEKLSEKGSLSDEQIADILYGNIARIVGRL